MAPGCERSRQVVARPGGCMQSRCGPCTGACAPSPMPRLLHFVPPFPVFCCPRPVARVLRSAFCVLRPASCTPCPVPASASTCSAFCVLRPTPASSVFRTRAPRPAPCARPVAPSSASRGRLPVFRALSPPPTLRGGSFRLRHAAGMKRKSGGSPQEPPDFACIAAARLTRACG